MRLRIIYESARLALLSKGIRPGIVNLSEDAVVPFVSFLDGRPRLARRRPVDAEEEGPLVVFVHGLGSSVVTWAAALPAVARRVPALAVDLPGYGRTPLPEGRSHLGLLEKVEVLERFIEAIAPERKVHLVGQSMGGWVSAWVAARRPDKVTRLTLVNPAGVFTPQVFEQRRLFTPRDKRETRVLWQRMWHRLPRSFPFFAGDYWRLTRTPEVRGFIDSVGEEDFLNEALAKITAPTLVVWGLSDTFLDFETVRLLQNGVPDVRVRLLPDCGHVPQREDPRRFLSLVLPWLEGREPPETERPGVRLTGPAGPSSAGAHDA
ncbi:MAG: alpha/beta hydrolase [Euryarchaeota archaeon]|nr:alpha/beta hydrolase [Euryarchaeota archaeon]